MQILQWLSKLAHEPPRVASSSPNSQNRHIQDKKCKNNEIARTKNPRKVEKIKLNCGNLNIFRFLRRRDVSEAYFCHTLNLKRLGNMQRRAIKMKKQDNINAREHKLDCTMNHGGNKVLPITDSSTQTKDHENRKRDQNKTISKMKDLIKWAANAKAHHKGGKFIGKKVLHIRDRGDIKNDDEFRNESPKISFKLELLETSSTVYSMGSTPLHLTNLGVDRPGSWITTDSEFVVLEL